MNKRGVAKWVWALAVLAAMLVEIRRLRIIIWKQWAESLRNPKGK